MNTKIVELLRHFNHTPESFEYMIKQLSKRTFDPVIEKIFSNSTDGRLTYEINDEYKELMDQGWKMFNEKYQSFIEKYNITYKNFLENKVIINKNEVKIKKALVQFLLDNSLSSKDFNRVLSNENIKRNKVFDLTEITSVYEMYNNSCKSICFVLFGREEVGNNRGLFIGVEEPHNQRPTLNRIFDIEFIDKDEDEDEDVDLNSLYIVDLLFHQKEDRGFETMVIAFNIRSEKYEIYLNNKNKRRKDFYKLSKNRELTDEEAKEFLSSDSNCLLQSDDEGNIKFWFLKEACLYFSNITVEGLNISFSPAIKTNISMPDLFPETRFSITKTNNEYLLSYNSSLNVLNIIPSADGINFEEEKKVKKALLKEYEGSYSFSKSVISFGKMSKDGTLKLMYTEEEKKSEEERKKALIEFETLKTLEEIGSVSLPKEKKIKLVLSINFCDWLLCSTGEKWTSCLNFESHFRAAHYQGLFGLLGDPNRIMIYFTDGTKKEYEGIESERMLTRSWCLLDKNDNINIVKFYPLNFITAETIKLITGLNVINLGPGFITKNPIHLLEFKYKYEENYNFSSYIYQDKTIFMYKDKETIHLVYNGEKGYYTLIRNTKSGKIYIEKTFSFNYEGGTRLLKEEGVTLTNYSIPIKFRHLICDSCGTKIEPYPMINEFIYNGEKYHTFRGAPICRRCATILFVKCSICNKIEPKTETSFIHFNGSFFCRPCHDYVSKDDPREKHLKNIRYNGAEEEHMHDIINGEELPANLFQIIQPIAKELKRPMDMQGIIKNGIMQNEYAQNNPNEERPVEEDARMIDVLVNYVENNEY
jgi:hypothetical protein